MKTYKLIGCSKDHKATVLGSFDNYFEAKEAMWKFENSGFSYFLVRF